MAALPTMSTQAHDEMRPWKSIHHRKYRIVKVPFHRRKPLEAAPLHVVRPDPLAPEKMAYIAQNARGSLPTSSATSLGGRPVLAEHTQTPPAARPFSSWTSHAAARASLLGPSMVPRSRGFHVSTGAHSISGLGWEPIQFDPEVSCVLRSLPSHAELLKKEILAELDQKHANPEIPLIPGNNPSNQRLAVTKEELIDIMSVMKAKEAKLLKMYDGADEVVVTGPLGKLNVPVPPYLKVGIREKEGEETRNTLIVRPAKMPLAKKELAMHGTTRALIMNAIKGVTEGFTLVLKFEGIGYRALMEEGKLSLKLGYSHPILLEIPQGCKVTIPSPTRVIVWGIDKQVVTQFAANIRKWRPPEPYKQKGVFVGEETIKKKDSKR